MGINEVGLSQNDEVLIKISKKFFRPLESDNYLADFSKAERELGWKPSTRFEQLVRIMVENDLALNSKT